MSHDLLYRMCDQACVRAWDNEGWGPYHKRLLTIAVSLEHNGWKKMNGLTQNDKIINHMMAHGSITQREAMFDYSIQSLTKRISELRNEYGLNIQKVTKRHPVTKQSYARYYLLPLEGR